MLRCFLKERGVTLTLKKETCILAKRRYSSKYKVILFFTFDVGAPPIETKLSLFTLRN